MATYCFDLDKTLFRFSHEPADADYEDPKTLFRITLAHHDRCRAVKDLMMQGHAVFFITGRRETIRTVTIGQLRRWIHPRISHHQLLMQTEWAGYDTMAAHKAKHLRRLKATQFVGDHQADADAAAMALVPFIHADQWLPGEIELHG